MYPAGSRNLRKDPRAESELPAHISIGTQLTVNGYLKDISSKSAFIKIKGSIFISMNDEVGFSIQTSLQSVEDSIHGHACVSRIVPGEGIAIYFTKMSESSTKLLKNLLTQLGLPT